MTDGVNRPLTSEERAVLLKILQEDRFPHAAVLAAQVPSVAVAGGIPTLLDLRVKDDAAGAGCPDGPAPGRAFVEGPDGEPLGEVLVWVEDGYLSGLEYAWFTDDAPDSMPAAERLSLTTDEPR